MALKLIYIHLLNGRSVRSIERQTGHHRETIHEIINAMEKNPTEAEKIIFFALNVQKADMNEMWRIINKNKKKKPFRAPETIAQQSES